MDENNPKPHLFPYVRLEDIEEIMDGTESKIIYSVLASQRYSGNREAFNYLKLEFRAQSKHI